MSKTGAIRYGLDSIKNVGTKASAAIIKERKKNGPYKDLFDLVDRTACREITSRTIESLIYAGALDSLPGSRFEKLASVVAATDRTSMQAEDRKRVAAGGKPVNRKRPIPDAVLLDGGTGVGINLLSKERELLGTYLSGHPFNDVGETFSVTSCDLQGVRDLQSDDRATICGIVSQVKSIVTKKKKKMYFITLEDSKVCQEVIVFPSKADDYGDFERFLDQPIVVSGRLEDAADDDEVVAPKFIMDKLYSLEEAPPIRKSKPKAAFDEVVPKHVNRIHLKPDNYLKLIKSATAPCTFVLPNGEELICA